MSLLSSLRFAVPLAVCLFVLPGCIEQSTVVKVDRNGSGIVHLRNHQQEVSLTIGSKEVTAEDESKLPSKERLLELAEKMGEGVRLKSAKETKNRSGWPGYELVFEFDDINQLVLTDEFFSPSDGDDKSEQADDLHAADDHKKTGQHEFRFSMNDGKLEIRNRGFDGDAAADAQEPQVDGAVDPFAGQPQATNPSMNLSEAVASQFYSKILADMRIGVFVEMDGEIASTNAKHRDQNLITLLNVNVGKLLEDPESAKHLQEFQALERSPQRREKTQELADQIDGIDIDTQNPILVQFR